MAHWPDVNQQCVIEGWEDGRVVRLSLRQSGWMDPKGVIHRSEDLPWGNGPFTPTWVIVHSEKLDTSDPEPSEEPK